MSGAPDRRITAVLPIKVESQGGDDLARAAILLRSLERFFRREDLAALHVVHHEGDDPEQLRRALAPFASLPLELVSEAELVPDLAGTSRRHWRKWFRKARAKNWFRQQVVKLCAAQCVQTDFYLTLDADVVCTQPTRADDLFVGERAILDLERRAEQPRWWRKSSWLVGVPLDLDGWGASVTPALLSKEIVDGLLAHLEERSGRRGWVELLLSTKGWTEYSLYDVYGRRSGLLEQRHYQDPDPEHPAHAIKRRDALWALPEGAVAADHAAILAAWAERAFDEKQPGSFSVVQSRTGIPADAVWAALRGRIGDGSVR